MVEIVAIKAIEALDSRGLPTVMCQVSLSDGSVGMSSVPSGKSVGQFEAVELRDLDRSRYSGKGVLSAIDNIHKIITPALKGFDGFNQQGVDEVLIGLDEHPQKANIGANATLAVSIAIARAAAASMGMPLFEYLKGEGEMTLPVPFVNVINGGAHANNGIDIQEFMIVPQGFSSFKDAIRCSSEIFHTLTDIYASKGFSTAVGDEGGLALALGSSDEALEGLMNAVEKAGYALGSEVSIALDVAASELYRDGLYHFEGATYDSNAWIDRMAQWIDAYPIVSVEDPMSDDDIRGWQSFTSIFNGQVQTVGDDVFVTHHERLKNGIDQGVASAILIKPNQIGTLTETMMAIGVAKSHEYGVMISHRSGDTEDTLIADLSVAVGANQIKTGSMSRGERIAKYNRLLWIEFMIRKPQFAGKLWRVQNADIR
ncbi:MAG: phosphopyruvate hydratase [Candidatus Comchoanobacterales bacterium]